MSLSEIEQLRKKINEEKIQIMIKKYNILACPKSGVPILNDDGKPHLESLKKYHKRKSLSKQKLALSEPDGHSIKKWTGKNEKTWICICGKSEHSGIKGAKRHFDEIRKQLEDSDN